MGATHCRWQRWLLLFSNLGAWHPSLGPTPQTKSAVPAWSRGPCFASVASPRVERSRQGRGAEVKTSFTCRVHRLASNSSWQARCFSPAAKAPIRAPRPAEGLKSQQKTMPKTPELRTEHRNWELAGPVTAMAGAGVR